MTRTLWQGARGRVEAEWRTRDETDHDGRSGPWRARWPWSPAGPGASARPSPCGWPTTGAKVGIVDLADNGAETAREIEQATGRPATFFKADISKEADAEAAVAAVEAALGPMDILVNNAGITRDGLLLIMGESRLGRRAGGQPQGRLPHEQGGAARHDQAPPGLHREHLQRGRPARQRRPGQLLGRQGGPDRADQVAGPGSGVAQRAGERGRARATSRPR